MKKFISLLSVIILVATSQSCRQDDENDLPITEKTWNKNTKKYKKDQQFALKDTIYETDSAIEASENEDPPVKNGTHWRIKK